jgi:hypothetical protein
VLPVEANEAGTRHGLPTDETAGSLDAVIGHSNVRRPKY